MKNIISILILVALLFSCALQKRKILNSTQYLTWYMSAENPLKFSDSAKNGVLTYLELRTLEYEASKCINSDCQPKDSVKKQLSGMRSTMDFVLRYKLPSQNMFDFNARSQIRSFERMEYYAFGFKNDIKLVTSNNDTIDCANLFFERTATEIPIGIFEFSFPYHEIENIKSIIIYNKAILNEATVLNVIENHRPLPKLKV